MDIPNIPNVSNIGPRAEYVFGQGLPAELRGLLELPREGRPGSVVSVGRAFARSLGINLYRDKAGRVPKEEADARALAVVQAVVIVVSSWHELPKPNRWAAAKGRTTSGHFYSGGHQRRVGGFEQEVQKEYKRIVYGRPSASIEASLAGRHHQHLKEQAERTGWPLVKDKRHMFAAAFDPSPLTPGERHALLRLFFGYQPQQNSAQIKAATRSRDAFDSIPEKELDRMWDALEINSLDDMIVVLAAKFEEAEARHDATTAALIDSVADVVERVVELEAWRDRAAEEAAAVVRQDPKPVVGLLSATPDLLFEVHPPSYVLDSTDADGDALDEVPLDVGADVDDADASPLGDSWV